MPKKKGPAGAELICPVCKKPFVPARPHQRFCNDPPGRCRKIEFLKRTGFWARRIDRLERDLDLINRRRDGLIYRLAEARKYAE